METREIIDSIDLRRKYDEKNNHYKRLLDSVSLILNSAIQKKGLKIHSFKARLKNYSSFLEKVERKRYEDPFGQCPDLAGCRIVCLFLSQVEQIKKIIEDEFEVVEVTNKKSSKKFDQFGYLSLHMVVKIPEHRKKFIEYKDLENLVCEIQIRTILQEAWAEIEHYLNYKATKEQKNDALLRKIFSLAGMFEVADSTFEDINKGFSQMVYTKVKLSEGSITALNLYKFSRVYFTDFNAEWDKSQERKFLKLSKEIKEINLHNILQVKTVLDKHKESIKKYVEVNRKTCNPAELIRVALALNFGNTFDLIFGLRGYSDKIKKQLK